MAYPERHYKIVNELGAVAYFMADFLETLELKLYMDKLDERLGLNKAAKELSEHVHNIRESGPGSEYARKERDKAYELVTSTIIPILDELKSYTDWNDKFWPSEINEVLDKYVGKLLKETEKPLKAAIEDIVYERRAVGNLYKDEKPSEEPPKRKRPQRKEEGAEDKADTTAAGDVVAMVTFLALGFVMLNGLNNLGAIPPGGELPSISTGFYLLPGGPFVSSMQMVLFLLTSAVVIVYLFGKSAGDW